MRSAISVSAFLLALGAFIGLVTAHYRPVASEQTVGAGDVEWAAVPYAAIVDDFDNEEATGSIGPADTSHLALDDEQRGFVFLGVINLPDIPDVAMRAPELATALPAEIEAHDIPAMVIRRIPQLRDYKFVKLDDRILLVGAHDRRVADMIPRYKLVIH
jgi:hypothetical protein